MRKFLSLIFLGLLAYFSTYPSFAHAFVTDSFPKVNTSVSQIPDKVWIEFDGNLTVFEGHEVNKLYVYDSNGIRIDDGKFQTGGARISVGIIAQATGKIRMNYRVVSEDGHPVEGELFFTSTFPLKSETPRNLEASKASKMATIKSKVKSSPKSDSLKTVSRPVESPENSLKEHLPHIIEFILAALMIFLWSLVRKYRNN
jgi:methionine-rich copper-binding protein CopC